jgi:predicted ATPase
MNLNDPDSFQELTDLARGLIPRLKRIRFRRERVYRTEREVARYPNETLEHNRRVMNWGELILLDYDHAENVSARTASEGTLLTLGLLTVLLGPVRPRVLLMDDLEHGLHPLALAKLMETIRLLQSRFTDLQILATSHSTRVLNHVQPEQVRLVAIGEDGYSHCGELLNHPKFDKWKDEFSPGEMWSAFGDQWVGEVEAVSS